MKIISPQTCHRDDIIAVPAGQLERNFQGGDATQLKIEPGDYIQLLIPQPRDGWHYGENDRTGLKGWFPIKYTIKV